MSARTNLPIYIKCARKTIWSTLLTTKSTDLLSKCLNHLSLVSTIFSTIGATPTLSLMLSFKILSHLVLPHIRGNIPVSAMLSITLVDINLYFTYHIIHQNEVALWSTNSFWFILWNFVDMIYWIKKFNLTAWLINFIFSKRLFKI